MVTVPFFCPDVPPLTRNPVFLYSSDRFQKPNPFEPDLVVSIDAVLDKKLEALSVLDSQFVEGGCGGNASMVSKNEQELKAARQRVKDSFRRRFAAGADQYRDKLIALYGRENGEKVQCAEAFEVCEYGSRPSAAQLQKLFPFLGD